MTESVLRILLVEDEPAHVEAIRRAFASSGDGAEIRVAETLRGFQAAVAADPPDIAVLDMNLPDGSAIEALAGLRGNFSFPVLIITGYGNEMTAVEAIKAGALDYIVKSAVAFVEMPHTVAGALREWNLLRDGKRAEEALRQAEENFHRSQDESPLGIRIVNAEGETLYANRAILDIYGYDDLEELKSTPVEKRYTPESYAEYRIRMNHRISGRDCPSEYEIGIIRKTGEIRRLQVFRKEVLWNGKKQFQAIYRDITEQKKAEEELQETLGGLRKAFSGIIEALSATAEQRDPYTAGHQKRVADLARAIGQEMGLSKERIEGLHMAGIIHDIGKVSIPAEILSKPSRLSQIERRLIQSHPEIGHDIVKNIDFSWPIAEMVLRHHERMDGSGYPGGLKGEDILFEARILAVADVVEAIASHRPYRPALGIEAALEEIEKNKGLLYDPDVVSACLRLFREKGFSLKS
jgi:PAS domain S-box-containing protein